MNIQKDLVSIIITTYNYGKYLDSAIGSALAQSYKNIEVIVIDDGSTDNTEELIKEYIEYKKIRYFKIPNSGQAVAKNLGIKYASSAYLSFLDADDKWDESKIEKQMPYFDDRKVGVVYSAAIDIDENDCIHYKAPIRNRYLQPKSGNILNNLLYDNFIPFSSAVIRRECLDKAGVFNESLRMGIDWDLWLRISLNYQFKYVAEPLLMYRIGHSGQMSKNQEERFRCSEKIMDSFLHMNSELIPNHIIKRAKSYSYANRGLYYSDKNYKMAIKYYFKAMRFNPLNYRPYKGLLKIAILRTLKRSKPV